MTRSYLLNIQNVSDHRVKTRRQITSVSKKVAKLMNFVDKKEEEKELNQWRQLT
jgi:hypothetical protein|tara:strand:- start:2331 stop:2492 length:162 start_codon:yes stop_codon:yes gene_type:complete